jgi:membrane protein YqaA with SNARE-associated domain
MELKISVDMGKETVAITNEQLANMSPALWQLLRLLFLSVIYLVSCCFFFIASAVIDFIFDGKVSLTREDIIDISVISTIAGVAGGLGSWVLAKIDERKANISSPSDPD